MPGDSIFDEDNTPPAEGSTPPAEAYKATADTGFHAPLSGAEIANEYVREFIENHKLGAKEEGPKSFSKEELDLAKLISTLAQERGFPPKEIAAKAKELREAYVARADNKKDAALRDRWNTLAGEEPALAGQVVAVVVAQASKAGEEAYTRNKDTLRDMVNNYVYSTQVSPDIPKALTDRGIKAVDLMNLRENVQQRINPSQK